MFSNLLGFIITSPVSYSIGVPDSLCVTSENIGTLTLKKAWCASQKRKCINLTILSQFTEMEIWVLSLKKLFWSLIVYIFFPVFEHYDQYLRCSSHYSEHWSILRGVVYVRVTFLPPRRKWQYPAVSWKEPLTVEILRNVLLWWTFQESILRTIRQFYGRNSLAVPMQHMLHSGERKSGCLGQRRKIFWWPMGKSYNRHV